jgi:hypothetical protein
LWRGAFPEYVAAPECGPFKNCWHVEKSRIDEYGHDIVDDYHESEKATLTDSEFSTASSIIKSVPDCKARFFKQWSENSDNEALETVILVRLSKTVDEFDLEADYFLSSECNVDE